MEVVFHFFTGQIALFFRVLLITSTCLTLLNGQDKSTPKTIYLKDGSVLKGQIIEDNEFFIQIVINTGDTLQVGYKNIVEHPVGRSSRRVPPEKNYSDAAFFWNINAVGHLIKGGGGEIIANFGYRPNNKLNFGIGVGALSREDELALLYLSPSYVHFSPFLRYYLTDQKPRIFISGSAGYSFALDQPNDNNRLREQHNAAFISKANAGIHFASHNDLRFLVQIGVSYHDTSGEFVVADPWVGEFITVYQREYISPTIGVLIEFK